MKLYAGLLLLALAGGVTLAQVEPPEYPEGVACSPSGDVAGGVVINPDHPCHCKRMDHDPICEGIPIEEGKCLQYCRHGHCSCPITCDPQPKTPDTEE